MTVRGSGRLLTLGFSPQGQLVTKDYPPQALAVIGLLVATSTMCIPLGALGTLITRCLRRGDTRPGTDAGRSPKEGAHQLLPEILTPDALSPLSSRRSGR